MEGNFNKLLSELKLTPEDEEPKREAVREKTLKTPGQTQLIYLNNKTNNLTKKTQDDLKQAGFIPLR